jgi:exopolysaccharide production protein ExoY
MQQLLTTHRPDAAAAGLPDERLAYTVAKRTLDLIVALIALAVLLPLLLFVAIAVRVTSPGPAIFTQVRCGRDGRRFTCYKFRTMVDGAERILEDDEGLRAKFNESWKIENDRRVTPLGSFLRKTSIDELPQLLNVLRGDMSLVGPRPVQPDELALFGEWGSTVTSVRPGLTGLWGISGRSSLPYDQRVALEVEYVRRRGFFYDLAIVIKTIPVVILSRGAV